MTLNTGVPVNFKPRPVEGAVETAGSTPPQSLLLDGQQRMTSLFQVTIRGKVVHRETPKKKKVERWFYLDIRKCMDASTDREKAVIGVPEDRIVRSDFGRETVLDLSTPEHEYRELMYPVRSSIGNWQDGFDTHWAGDANDPIRKEFCAFKRQVLENFKEYQVPVIALDSFTSKEAVCVVFERSTPGASPLMRLSWSRPCMQRTDMSCGRTGSEMV